MLRANSQQSLLTFVAKQIGTENKTQFFQVGGSKSQVKKKF